MPRGEVGELVIRGPQIMRGYWNMPEETAHALRDGWLYTGDLAVIDEDGFYRIVGRKKEMIVVSGYKVFPDEVDGGLMGHPAVLQAATTGLTDAKRGERVKSQERGEKVCRPHLESQSHWAARARRRH